VLPFGEVELAMPWTAAGVFVSVGLVGSFLGRTFALKGIDEVGASRAQSIVNSAPLLTAVYAVILLGETATPVILIGVLLIVSGLLIITRGSPDEDDSRLPLRFRAFLNPLLAIIFFGFGPILKKVAMLAGGTPVPGSLITHVTGLALVMSFGRILRIDWRQGIRIAPDSYFFLLMSGFFQGVGSIFTYLAVAHAPAIIVAPIWNVQPLVTFSLARLLLREDEAVTLKDGLAAVLVVAGVFFLFQARG
jgi:transporter family protein